MKTKLIFCILLITSLISDSVKSQNESFPGKEDKTGSPYFYIPSDDPENEYLPLKSTSADVNIAGVIADVMVTQEYKNEGKKPIEAIYVFPASTRAAVYSMVMTIGERISNLERLIFVREGVSRKDDSLPPRMKEAVPNGPVAGHFINDDMLDVMLDEYYGVRGWDSQGIPLHETIQKLGLAEIPALA